MAIPAAFKEAGKSSPIAVQTKLGWVAYGPTVTSFPSISTVLHLQDKQPTQDIHDMITDFFATENFGTNPDFKLLLSDDVQIGRNIMEKTIKRIGKRFEIGLLYKEFPPKLPSSYAMAEKRLFTIEKKMHLGEKFAERYRAEVSKYVEKGYARKLTSEELQNKKYPIWYLPHFGVINPHKPEKLRVGHKSIRVD